MKTKILIALGLMGICFGTLPILAANYSKEQQNAYRYAYSRGITTQTSIEKASMNGSLTRIAMAKMISNYAINVLGLKPDTTKHCSFEDVSLNLDAKYSLGATQACQLGLMGIGNDGKVSKTFNPDGIVTRGQRATVFSRALSQSKGDKVEEGDPYYKNHMSYLNKQGIIKDVNKPSHNTEEKRGNVMIMMYRADGSEYDNEPESTDYDLETQFAMMLAALLTPQDQQSNTQTFVDPELGLGELYKKKKINRVNAYNTTIDVSDVYAVKIPSQVYEEKGERFNYFEGNRKKVIMMFLPSCPYARSFKEELQNTLAGDGLSAKYQEEIRDVYFEFVMCSNKYCINDQSCVSYCPKAWLLDVCGEGFCILNPTAREVIVDNSQDSNQISVLLNAFADWGTESLF